MKIKEFQSRQPLLIILLGLSLITIFGRYQQSSPYHLSVFQTNVGWGYAVITNGDSLIYQPTIPGIAGRRGFGSEEQAREVGKHIVAKLEKGEMPPTITYAELTQLGIVAP